jgi:AAA+ ATPase superfamily predicted ATPase
MMDFFGREKELESLNLLAQKKTASLVILKGRRRIGKSTLVAHFGQQPKNQFFSFSGLAPNPQLTAQDQRDFFAKKLKEYFNLNFSSEDWWDLFMALNNQLNHPAQNKTSKVNSLVILLDEISWMADGDSTFLPKFKEAWDNYFKKNHSIIFILCGSVSSWIEKNILANTGFVGRVSLKMELKELPLNICNQFFGENLSGYDKLKFLSVTGGVPKYLEELNPGLSIDENIRRLCFLKEGFLYNEFDQIFNDALLSNALVYKKIVLALSEGSLNRTEIIQKIQLCTGGDVDDYLNNLMAAGFVSREHTWNIKNTKISKLSQFRLSDNYLRFYLKAILPNQEKIKQDLLTESSLSSFLSWNSLIGLQFESLILNNRQLLLPILGIHPDEVLMSNPYFQRQTLRQKGCQIDLLIQTKTNVLYACEVKFSKNPVETSVIEEMKEKLLRFNAPRQFSVIPVLIHANGVSDGLLETQYFYRMVDFERLLSNR